ncbi:uncharacterized protein GGS22DRAFT_200036 [Annulohypoxylon maeteangense]|uniref:uncharacterized protein n=1 Tax=Annulohypoxylon maeteangense TaxID=1927788 RepID=UPI0020080F4D|nr:uncharacterized protein GGS22DRAFT_200036 [Annulohypoxylon maeteangense]KAI0885898.1 hypothetical protein GGS22DRAFT_200036 [Annulohypoxylon maeteangense]
MAPGTSKTKVKTGCRTCKIRKVKCDESFPSCKRCLSTGRICEGYGIWGGGTRSNPTSSISPHTKSLEKVIFAPTPIKTATKEESRYLEWFTHRSAFKLPGIFRLELWDKLVFQAASTEPAVRHAILALGSAHKREGRANISAPGSALDKEEHFTLQHYSKAITHLQPHFSARDNSSIRVGLLTCLIFVIMELIRGHWKTAIAHLQSGLKLLDEFQARSSEVDGYSLFLEPCHASVDSWIIQAFIRLDVQTKLMGQNSHSLNMIHEDCNSEIPIHNLTFQSVHEARQHLDRLLGQILYLSHEYRSQVGYQVKINLQRFLIRQRRIEAKLGSWYQAYKNLKAVLAAEKISTTTIAFTILYLYYLMAGIMVDTCLRPADQLRYDIHTTSFLLMMEQLKLLRYLTSSAPLDKELHLPNMTNTISDLGAFPALFCVAIKCRVSWIRHDAVGFLKNLAHNEGIWNGPLIASIADEVVRIEEGSFYEGSSAVEQASFYGASNKLDVLQPTLPESHRMHDVKIELPEDYAGTVTLKCTRVLEDHSQEVITREFVYNESARRWVVKDGDT